MTQFWILDGSTQLTTGFGFSIGGSNKFFLLKVFAITHNFRTSADQSRGPQVECLWGANASSLTHQVSNNSPHRFHRPGRGRQVQIGKFTIGPELICAPEKLSHHPAGTDSAAGLTNEVFEAPKDPLKLVTVGKLQCLTGELIAGFTHGSVSEGSLSGSPIALQLADEMEMTQLQGPTFVCRQRGNTSDLIGDYGRNALLYAQRNGADRFQPAIEILPTREKQGIEEKSVISMTRFECHEIKHPRAASETKVKAVDQEHQWACRYVQGAILRHHSTQGSTKTMTQGLRGQSGAWSEPFQSFSFQQHGIQKTGGGPPTLATSFFLPDAPRPLAMAALTTSRAEAVSPGPATGRFRVQRIHARELHTD